MAPGSSFRLRLESVFYLWYEVLPREGANEFMSTSTSTTPAARIVLVGVRGFGEVHAERIARLTDEGLVELVAAVDPGVVLDPPTIYGAPLYADLAEALSVVGPVDVVVIAAPLGEHFRLATIALTAGADVYLEKPPVASMEDFTRLLGIEQESGRVVQVGFQSLGSEAVRMLTEDAFEIGPVYPSERSGGMVAHGRLLDPFAVGRSPQLGWTASRRWRCDQCAGPRRRDGSLNRRLPPDG